MKKKGYLYSPWRLDYILSGKCAGCIFCCQDKASEDAKHLIVYRSRHCYVMLNLYPYNNGHIMVVPNAHVSRLADLSKTAAQDLFETVRKAESILFEVYNCEGMNIGINLGKAGGAGVDEHVHVHLVPRWSGDINFMTVIGGERVIPEAFDQVYKKLHQAFSNHGKKPVK
jgi:ATP adenylyltransferase